MQSCFYEKSEAIHTISSYSATHIFVLGEQFQSHFYKKGYPNPLMLHILLIIPNTLLWCLPFLVSFWQTIFPGFMMLVRNAAGAASLSECGLQ